MTRHHLPESAYWFTLPIERLEEKLRGERQRALSGHWAYDYPRHMAMLAAYKERMKAEGMPAKELESVS